MGSGFESLLQLQIQARQKAEAQGGSKTSDSNPTKQVESILRFFDTVVGQYNEMIDTKDWCENKTQDLLHELELVPHSFNERGKMAKELSEVRQKRRSAKDGIEMLNPLVDWCGKHKSSIDALTRVLGEMRKTCEKQANRLYYKRADGSHEIIGRANNG